MSVPVPLLVGVPKFYFSGVTSSVTSGGGVLNLFSGVTSGGGYQFFFSGVTSGATSGGGGGTRSNTTGVFLTKKCWQNFSTKNVSKFDKKKN